MRRISQKIKKKYGNRFSYYRYALSNKEEDIINFGTSTGGLSSLEKSINEIDYLKKSNVNSMKIEKKNVG